MATQSSNCDQLEDFCDEIHSDKLCRPQGVDGVNCSKAMFKVNYLGNVVLTWHPFVFWFTQLAFEQAAINRYKTPFLI